MVRKFETKKAVGFDSVEQKPRLEKKVPLRKEKKPVESRTEKKLRKEAEKAVFDSFFPTSLSTVACQALAEKARNGAFEAILGPVVLCDRARLSLKPVWPREQMGLLRA